MNNYLFTNTKKIKFLKLSSQTALILPVTLKSTQFVEKGNKN